MRLRVAILAATVMAASSTGVAAQHTTEPVPEPVAFSARWIASENLGQPDSWGTDGIDPLHGIDGRWPFEVEMTTDPRMAGEVVYHFNDDHYRSVDLHVHHSAFRVVNEDGVWQEAPALVLGHPDMRPSTRTAAFTGEDGYDGLVAIAELTWDRADLAWDVVGYIIEGEITARPGEGSFPE